ncbi:MAG: molybdate ABC transporter substrate-binding protein [Lachnospiraceae bacterium]|nr:molybdate ABC transporter substrate-binding protein [Robinsoniella sp.]MDY3767904.1 molybdate ABC transporter substrate-binding protein [Lachnospiraceae bacterium]
MKKKIMGIAVTAVLVAGTIWVYQDFQDSGPISEWIYTADTAMREKFGQGGGEEDTAKTTEIRSEKGNQDISGEQQEDGDLDSDKSPDGTSGKDSDAKEESESETRQGTLITKKKESESETEEPGYGSPLIRTKTGDGNGGTQPEVPDIDQEPDAPGLGTLIKKKEQLPETEPAETEPDLQQPVESETEPEQQKPGQGETRWNLPELWQEETQPKLQGPGEELQPSSEKQKTELHVFMTASLEQMADEMKQEYEAKHPDVSLVVTVGEEDELYQKVQQDEICDVYLSASLQMLEILADEDKIDRDSIQVVAEDPIVLIQIENGDTKVKDFGQISEAQDVVIAEETTALGKASREVLENFGVYEQVMEMDLSEVGNANAVMASVSTKSSEVGIVYGSDAAKVEEMLEVIAKAPSGALSDHVYYYSGLSKDRNQARSTENGKADAEEFLSYLDSDEAANLFEKCGLSVESVED